MNWDTVNRDFKRYLLLERGLAENSIEAYQNDVLKLQHYCELHEITIRQITTKELQNFLLWINEFSISTYSQARILSGIKTFFKFLQIEYDYESNPAELIEAPRIARKLPSVLSIEEIDQLIAAIDLSRSE